ncbi:MAG TPA: MMPL family transporter [Acidimicrobiales bacterium]|nr:MMPL family transporter [Acidimicrobiales bacterium]
MAPSPNLAASAGAWSSRHRRKAIFGWLVFVFAAYLVGSLVGQRNLTDAQMGNGQSGRATSTMQQAFPFHNGEEVLIQGKGASVTPAALQGAVGDLVARLRQLRTVAAIQAPFLVPGASTAPALRSADGRSVLVTFEVAGNSNQAQTNVEGALTATAATARAHPQLRIEEFGSASATKALMKAYTGDFNRAEHTSLPITMLILLIAFGALVAAGVPLLLGFTAVIAALGLIKPVSHLYPVAQGQIAPVVLLVGLAVGVDYSMFYLRRKLQERAAGRDGDSALARAAATSGKAVLISGLTVIAAMAGMLLAGNSVFVSLGMGTMIVVAVAVIGSVTVLPAVMAWLGDRIEWGRVPVVARRRATGRSRAWETVVGGVLRRPLVSVVLAVGALVALAAPVLQMRTVDPGFTALPRNLPIVQTFDRIEKAFPGAPISAVVVVKAADVTATPVAQAITALGFAVEAHSPQLAGPVVETVSADKTVALVTVSLAGTGTDSRSTSALSLLRNTVVPATLGRVPGTAAYVGGPTAGSVDFNATMKAHLPVVFVFVLVMAFLLLLLSFRSLVIPLLTIALNLLSVGASYGLMVLVFQKGYGRALLGAQDVGGVINWIPLFLLVILFGLSMDYHVLILSRIREARQAGRSPVDAVKVGITSTAGVITSAALVMVAVFAVFATLSEVDFKQLGVALASAVFIDATVVRIVLLPAAMALLGRHSWYLPRWLGFLERRPSAVTPEPDVRAPDAAGPAIERPPVPVEQLVPH